MIGKKQKKKTVGGHVLLTFVYMFSNMIRPKILPQPLSTMLAIRVLYLFLIVLLQCLGPLVHRQTASTIVKHVALGVAGLGCEDSMLHLMNLVWPNCFETSPHVIGAVMDAIEAMRVTLGPGVLLSYVLQGLFHHARKVREVYWRIYNALYLGAEDALVPFYPDLGELTEGKNKFDRHPLQVFI